MAERNVPGPMDGAVFDVKGVGVPPDEQPYLPNSNGLLTLDEAVHEVLMEHLVFAVMRRAGVDVRPLPSYAVIDLGFDAVWADGRPPQRAVALVRRAATRPRCQWSRHVQGPETARMLMQIELLLRRAGISASVCGAVRFRLTADGPRQRIVRDDIELPIPDDRKAAVFAAAGWKGQDLLVDGVNVQITSGYRTDPLHARVMDFGRYRFQDGFSSPLYSWFDADYQNMNGAYLQPDDPLYAQPDGNGGLARFNTAPAYGALLAATAAYQHRRASRADLARALRAAVDAAVSMLGSMTEAARSVTVRPLAVPPVAGAGWRHAPRMPAAPPP